MPDYWIIGAGQVGRRAVERLGKKAAGRLLVVDCRPPRWTTAPEPMPCFIRADGVAYLSVHVRPGQVNDPWIVPALPIHLAYQWLAGHQDRGLRFKALPVPEAVSAGLPNAERGDAGQVFLSNADFICPDNCPEPPNICTHTGRPRPRIMHAFLRTLKFQDYQALVVRSQQLAPGIGGYRASELLKILAAVTCSPGRYLLATACKCHGVMHAFETGDR